MEENLKRLWHGKYYFFGHLILNIALLLYGIFWLFDEECEPLQITKYIVLIAIVVVFFIVDIIDGKSKRSFLEKDICCIIYYTLRPIVFIAFYYLSTTRTEKNIFLIMLILGMTELIYHTGINNMLRRYTIYALFLMAYSVASVVMLISMIQNKDSQVTLMDGIREISFVVIVTLLVLFLGEAISMLYAKLEERIFKQNRALEDLNQANDTLQEQQEKINLVNEKLGMQKIELQAANKRINRAHDELSVQNEISAAIASSVEKEEMLTRIVDIMQIRLDMDVVAIILEEDNSLLIPGEEPTGRYVALSTSLGEDFKNNLLKSIHQTDLKQIMTMTQPYLQNSHTESGKLFDYLTEKQELTSLICLPIMNQDERTGTLFVGKDRINVFMDGRAFYENIASQLSIGIANAKLYAKMNDMAIRDGLTRLYNRRHLTELLSGYLSDAIGHRSPVSLALFDIDKFKMVNDTYGHQCGDEVIRYVATLLNKGAIKNGGVAGRYGGEEFVVIFPGKGLDETYEIIKEIHEQIRSKEVVFGDKHVPVRASAGVASYPSTCSNPSDLLTRADWAMYHSKENGRDQITIDSDKIVNKM